MFYGVGTDIIEISRMKKSLENSKFKERIFTSSEIQLIEGRGGRVESYAGRFSGKEAVAKALGTGVRGFNFVDIEILSDDLGKPVVNLKNKLKNLEDEFRIEISISHCKEYATATVIILRK